MALDPRRLSILLAVARSGGVLAAADELGITPSAVSQGLAKLERESGHALVRRTARGSVLTEAGRLVAEAAEEVERALNVAQARLNEAGAELVGQARIGAFGSFLRTLVIPRLPEWHARFPGLRIALVEDDLPSLMRQLRRGMLDVVIAELDAAGTDRSPLPAGVVEQPLLDEPWKLVVPTGTVLPGGVPDLARLPLPWLGVNAHTASAAAVERLRRASGSDRPEIHSYLETATALDLVAAGEGVALVPMLALHGVTRPGVDVLDVPGIGARRIVVRRYDRPRGDATPTERAVQLMRESAAGLDLELPTP